MICTISEDKTKDLIEKYNLKDLVLYNNDDVYIDGLLTVENLRMLTKELVECIKQK